MVAWTGIKLTALVMNALSSSIALWQIFHIISIHYRGHRKYTRQTLLRMGSYSWMTLTNISHQIEAFYLYSAGESEYLNQQDQDRLWTLASYYGAVYAVSTLVGVCCYVFCLLDRFDRLELILAGTWKQKLSKLYKGFLIVLFFGTIILEIVWRTLNIGIPITQKVHRDLFLILQLCELICYLFAIVTEFYVNIRLLKISIQTDSTPVEAGKLQTAASRPANSTRRVMIKLTRAKAIFKTVMMQTFIILVLLDLGILCLNIVPQLIDQSELIAFNNIMSAWLVIHAFVSFKLLDLFLMKLSDLKHNQNRLRNDNRSKLPEDQPGDTFNLSTSTGRVVISSNTHSFYSD